MAQILRLILSVFFIASLAHANDRPLSLRTSTPEFLVQSNAPLTNVDQTDLAVSYSGSEYRNDLFNEYSRDFLISEIYRDQQLKASSSSSELLIPFGPSLDFSDLEAELKTSKFYSINLFRTYKREMRQGTKAALEGAISSLSEAELKTFLSKKHEYLKDVGSRLESIFLKLKLKPNYKFINGFVKSLNNMIYMRANAFIHSNTTGFPFYLTVGFGAAFGKLLYDLTIARSPLKKYIKPNFGFYFLTAFGIAFSTTKIDGRKLRTFDFFIDFEHFKQALTPVFEGFGGFGYGFHFESRSTDISDKGKTFVTSNNSYNEAKYIPLVGMLKVGEKDFSINHGAVATVPLYSLFHDNKFSRKYWHFTYYDSEIKKPALRQAFEAVFSLFKKSNSTISPSSLCLKSYSI